MTVFHNESREKRWAAFAAPYPGKIQAMHLSQLGGEIIAQKDSFLAAAKGVSIGIAFQRRFGAGLFGGEGFIMQRLEGDGWAFVNAGGTLEERTLAPGETLRVDTGCLVAPAADRAVRHPVRRQAEVRALRRGGPLLRDLRGPGRVWLQSLPFSRLAGRIYAAAPQTGGRRQEEDRSSGVSGT